MNRKEITAAYEAANIKFNADYAIFEAARNHFFAIPGKASDADFAAFGAAQTALDAARAEFDIAFNAMCELPEEEETASDDAEQFSFAL